MRRGVERKVKGVITAVTRGTLGRIAQGRLNKIVGKMSNTGSREARQDPNMVIGTPHSNQCYAPVQFDIVVKF